MTTRLRLQLLFVVTETTQSTTQCIKYRNPSWLHRASNNVETFSLPTDAHNVKKHRVIKTF